MQTKPYQHYKERRVSDYKISTGEIVTIPDQISKFLSDETNEWFIGEIQERAERIGLLTAIARDRYSDYVSGSKLFGDEPLPYEAWVQTYADKSALQGEKDE